MESSYDTMDAEAVDKLDELTLNTPEISKDVHARDFVTLSNSGV